MLFVAGLFVTTFERLSTSADRDFLERILTLYTVASAGSAAGDSGNQVAEHLREVNGVEKVALAEWPILDGWGFRMSGISMDGAPPAEVAAWFLNISPGLLDAMKIPILAGRDFRENDAGAAIVNSAFARAVFQRRESDRKVVSGESDEFGPAQRFQIVGLARDARYRYLREGFLPVAYIPFRRLDAKGAVRGRIGGRLLCARRARILWRWRRFCGRRFREARPEFRVSNIRTQKELIESQTIREQAAGDAGFVFRRRSRCCWRGRAVWRAQLFGGPKAEGDRDPAGDRGAGGKHRDGW